MYAVCGNIMSFEQLNIVKFVPVRNLKSQRRWPMAIHRTPLEDCRNAVHSLALRFMGVHSTKDFR